LSKVADAFLQHAVGRQPDRILEALGFQELVDQLRAILLERGLVFPKGRRKLELAIDALLLGAQPALGVRMQKLIALVAAVDDAAAFRRARDLPAWLGLVPRQHRTGCKPKLLGISRRGNSYLRRLFIPGA
jgi:transposase